MQIAIQNIKNVSSLSFDLPPPGVWILTGANGSGKTCLLAAIYRIRAQHAFQKYYRTSPEESRLDSYAESSVTYTIAGRTVTYSYGGQRWRAIPQANSKLFSLFPYPSIEYIDADASRIEPYANEIKPRRVKDATVSVCDFLAYVLNDHKWEKLKYVNTQRGRGSAAYLIPYQKDNKTFYFSEKSFSLGELCVFKLARQIDLVPNRSLLLIDELEMALHPQAQIRLVEAIRSLAVDKELTVIFSTHSASIIKSTDRRNLIYLKKDDEGNVTPVRNAFPAQILGDVAFDEELTADFIFFVEDKQAKILLEQMIGKHLAGNNADRPYQPLYKVVPIGGYPQVIEMMHAAGAIFPAYVKRFAFLDADVNETLAEAKRKRNQVMIDLFRLAPQGINFLPCTPELGLIEMIESPNNGPIVLSINRLFGGQAVHLDRIIQSRDYLQFNGAQPRDRAKKRMTYIAQKISASTQIDELQIRRTLYTRYIDHLIENSPAILAQIFGPIFR